MDTLELPPMPRHFRVTPTETALSLHPTGVWDYERVPLRDIFPALGDITLYTYQLLRIGCCGRMHVDGQNKLLDCEVCYENRGIVCPHCRGGRWVKLTYKIGMTECPSCTLSYVEGKDIITKYDPEKERMAIEAWLARLYPYGLREPVSREEVVRGRA